MADATKTIEGEGAQQVQAKRIPTLSEKGLAMQVERCQKKLKAKSVQVGKCMENIKVLIKSVENVKVVQSELNKLMDCFDEMTDVHNEFMMFNMPEEEVTKQCDWYDKKQTKYCDFIAEVRKWLCHAGQPLPPPGATASLNVAKTDEIRPEDSISNVVSRTMSRKKSAVPQQQPLHSSKLRLKRQLLWSVLLP